ncbi:hypothetical protein ACFL27_09205 [candidate division CSSED10-310 bacterium]|uniref:Uncharacterized protein n=1 Tax=candidate division CSSED10-310 bacterium TaxID=2855610 RepID=A0ABV6YVX5_UNCC1
MVQNFEVAQFKKHATLFRGKVTLKFNSQMQALFDKRLGLVGALLLLCMDRRAF